MEVTYNEEQPISTFSEPYSPSRPHSGDEDDDDDDDDEEQQHDTPSNHSVKKTPLQNNIIVSKLAPGVTYNQINSLLNKTLKLRPHKVLRNKYTRKMPNKTILIHFESEEDIQHAIRALHGFHWHGKRLTAKKIKSKQEKRKERKLLQLQKLQATSSTEESDPFLDSFLPLRRMTNKEQALHKTNNSKGPLRELVKKVLHINSATKSLYFWQRRHNNGFPLKMYTTKMCTNPTQYQNRVEMTIGKSDTGDKVLNLKMPNWAPIRDFCKPVVPICDSIGLPENVTKLLVVAEDHIRGSPLDVAKSGQGHWLEMMVRWSSRTDQLMVVFSFDPGLMSQEDLSHVKDSLNQLFISGPGQDLNVTSLVFKHPNTKKDEELDILFGGNYIIEMIHDLQICLTPLLAFPSNTEGVELMYESVIEHIQPTPQTTLLHISCGEGALCLFSSRHCGKVIGLELNQAALNGARESIALNNLNNCDFVTGPMKDTLPSILNNAKSGEIVPVIPILGNGCDGNILNSLRKCPQVKRMVLIAANLCSSDLIGVIKVLAKPWSPQDGIPYVPVTGTVIDMYPQTERYETVLYLDRFTNRKPSDYEFITY